MRTTFEFPNGDKATDKAVENFCKQFEEKQGWQMGGLGHKWVVS